MPIRERANSLLEWFAPSRIPRLEGVAILKIDFRFVALVAIAVVVGFAVPGSVYSSAQSPQEDQADKPKPQRSVEPPPRIIAMTAKDFEFDPPVIHMKVGDKVRLEVISSDRTHGLHISPFPDGAKVNTAPGLAFIFGEDCWKLKKGESVPVDIEATEPGTYSFQCCKTCGTGHKRMKGQIIVEP
jgi:heme/copper-type cytochrome/quinol oxidase subunit 2